MICSIFWMWPGQHIYFPWIYAAAVLHDIGKWMQYAQKIPHEQASAQIAEQILEDTGFEEDEKKGILLAILSHREHSKENGRGNKLAEVLYDADKTSRNCFACTAKEACDWGEEKKNLRIIW